ncbi:MAG: tetratricopeptide repeat protein [Myxococcota bacterium]
MRTILVGLVAALLTVGCGGKKVKSIDMESNNPKVNFQGGLDVIDNPDRRTGAVDYEKAYTLFNKAANLGAGKAASFNAGWTAEQLGRPADAELHYRKAYEADPAMEKAMFSLARVLLEQGKNDEAVALYESRVESQADDIESRNELIAALVKAGRYDEALQHAQTILRDNPDNADVYRNLSALYYAQDNYSMSQLMAEKALELNAGDPGVYNNMGVTYLIQGDEPSAIAKFKEAVNLDTKNFEANMNLGYVALASGDFTLAKTSFESATTANPSSLDAKLGHAVALRGTGETKEADELYDQIIKANPKYDRAYFNGAILHLRYTKDFKKSLDYIQRYKDANVGQIAPDHPIFGIQTQVEEAQEQERLAKEAEERRKREEEERRKREEQLLKDMAVVITDTQQKLTTYSDCIDEGSVEQVSMILEQAQIIVDQKDASMAQDVQQLMDAFLPSINEVIQTPECQALGSGGGAPAPAEEPAEAPAEEPAEAPAEEATPQ